jgi:hypothetical protein
LFALVMAGEVRGSAPTHHGERALLAVWFGMALLTARSVERLRSLPAKQLRVVAVLGCVSFLLGNRMRREYPRDPRRCHPHELAQRKRCRRGVTPPWVGRPAEELGAGLSIL